jgi:hypothetical protein
LVDYDPSTEELSCRGRQRCHRGRHIPYNKSMDTIERKKQESKLRREASRKTALEPTSTPAPDGAGDAPAKRKERKARKGSGPESRTFGGLSGVLEDINIAALPAQLWTAAPLMAALLVLAVQNLMLRYAEAQALSLETILAVA